MNEQNDQNEQNERNRKEWKSLRREHREREKRSLRQLCEVLDIKEDVSELHLCPVDEFADLFPDTKIFAIKGPGFERPSLPSSSYMYFAYNPATKSDPVELTPRNGALNDLLAAHWQLLPQVPPVRLAAFVLTMGIVGTVGHDVLRVVGDLDDPVRRDQGYLLTAEARRLVADSSLATSLDKVDNGIVIHALTLFGWMHKKQDLGVTDIHVSGSGDLRFGDRQSICRPVFRNIPVIYY